MERVSVPVKPSLTVEQIERIKELGAAWLIESDLADLCDMALRYLDTLEQEPVAWMHKETKELNHGWDAILDNTGNWMPLLKPPEVK